MITIKTDQETGIQTFFDENGRITENPEYTRLTKIEDAIQNLTDISELVNTLTDLGCRNIENIIRDKYTKGYIISYLVETLEANTDNLKAKDQQLASVLNCINTLFNLIEQQIEINKLKGNNDIAMETEFLLGILKFTAKQFTDFKKQKP